MAGGEGTGGEGGDSNYAGRAKKCSRSEEQTPNSLGHSVRCKREERRGGREAALRDASCSASSGRNTTHTRTNVTRACSPQQRTRRSERQSALLNNAESELYDSQSIQYIGLKSVQQHYQFRLTDVSLENPDKHKTTFCLFVCVCVLERMHVSVENISSKDLSFTQPSSIIKITIS